MRIVIIVDFFSGVSGTMLALKLSLKVAVRHYLLCSISVIITLCTSDHFLQDCKRRANGDIETDPTRRRPPYKHFESLSFLLPVLKNRDYALKVFVRKNNLYVNNPSVRRRGYYDIVYAWTILIPLSVVRSVIQDKLVLIVFACTFSVPSYLSQFTESINDKYTFPEGFSDGWPSGYINKASQFIC